MPIEKCNQIIFSITNHAIKISSCPYNRIIFKKSYFVGTDSINAHKWQWCTWSNFCEHRVTSEVTYLLYIFQFVDFLLASIPLTHTLTQTHTPCLSVCLSVRQWCVFTAAVPAGEPVSAVTDVPVLHVLAQRVVTTRLVRRTIRSVCKYHHKFNDNGTNVDLVSCIRSDGII